MAVDVIRSGVQWSRLESREPALHGCSAQETTRRLFCSLGRRQDPAVAVVGEVATPVGTTGRMSRGTRTAFRRLAGVAADRRRAVPGVREIDLREDLDHGSPAGLDDPDVVLRVEAAVPQRENGSVPPPFVGRLRERESFQITLFILTQSGQRLVLSNHQHARGRHARAPGATMSSSGDAFGW